MSVNRKFDFKAILGLVLLAMLASPIQAGRISIERISSSSLRSLSAAPVPRFLVRADGIPGHSYAIQAADSLQNPVWFTIAIAVANRHGEIAIEDTASSVSMRFYRVIEL